MPVWPGLVSSSNCGSVVSVCGAHAAAASFRMQPEVARAARGDQLDHLVVVDVLGLDLRHHPPQEQAGDVVRDLEDVVHVVGDQHDADAVVRQPAHQLEHLLGLGHAQRGGRLVEDHELGVPQHGAGDRHRLALTARERGDALAQRVQRPHRQRLQRLPRPLLHLGLVEREPGLQLAPEEHVVDDVEVVAQREVLVDDLDAERVGVLRAVTVTGSPSKRISPVVEGVDPGDALDQRALAGAVVTHERGHAAGPDVEVDVVQHVHGAEALVDASEGQQRAHEMPFAVQAFLRAAVVQILAEVVKPSSMTSLTLSGKIASRLQQHAT